MATTALDKAGCGCKDAESLGAGCGDGLLPASPFTPTGPFTLDRRIAAASAFVGSRRE